MTPKNTTSTATGRQKDGEKVWQLYVRDTRDGSIRKAHPDWYPMTKREAEQTVWAHGENSRFVYFADIDGLHYSQSQQFAINHGSQFEPK